MTSTHITLEQFTPDGKLVPNTTPQPVLLARADMPASVAGLRKNMARLSKATGTSGRHIEVRIVGKALEFWMVPDR